MATKKKVGRPRKTAAGVLKDYQDGPTAKIYGRWWAAYENALQAGMNERAARGWANETTARTSWRKVKNGKPKEMTIRQIQNIVSSGNALRRDLGVQALSQSAKTDKRSMMFQQSYAAVERAVQVLQKPAYEDLLKEVAMLSRAKVPRAMRAFSGTEAATSPDSLQTLTAALAKALLRAHELLEKEAQGYSQRAPSAKQK